ncbi:MAG: carboxy terminal-processing peptidase [Gammaproteobacteria bacterium]|nr:carboxy terminal-processing peptidase [Gammaproteobacteria bacterium]
MIKIITSLFIAVQLFVMQAALAATEIKPLPEHGLSSVLITKLIERHHYKKTHLNDALSQQILEQYLKSLDPTKSILTEKEVAVFQRYSKLLDDAIKTGKLDSAFNMFEIFNERRIERANYAIKILDQNFDFNRDESFDFDRSDMAWPKNEAELNEIWRKRVKNDVLSLQLAGKKPDELKKTLRKRYERIKTYSQEIRAEDVYEIFINAYLQALEPHTSYFSPRNTENFKINMSLSLEGIGAVLQRVDDYTVVQRIITGGPADSSGLLRADDKIVGVAQGKNGEMEDIIGWRLDDVVELIRGPKDSVVRLQVLPKSAGPDGATKIITLVRNKIKLEEQQAKKSIMELGAGKDKRRIGVITLPTFYMDFDAYARGDDDYKSTTRDTEILLSELKKDNVDGIVIDLRGNGGGSLPEAVALTGLFIHSGPVVQIKDNTGNLQVDRDEDNRVAYDGPMAVLVDRYSASASEIFAGAIKDYGRGLIIGEPTYGKGTVQTVIDLNRFTRSTNTELGQIKLTMAQFFRVNGDSTQHEGVTPDIPYPVVNNKEMGERALENALPWASIKPAPFQRINGLRTDLKVLKDEHSKRIANDAGFDLLVAQDKELRDVLDKKSVSLKKSAREKERIAQESARHDRLNRFRLSRGLPALDKENIDEEGDTSVDDKLKEELENIKLREAASVLADQIRLNRTTPVVANKGAS